MSCEAWFDIVHFGVPFYENKTKPSKLNSVKKVLEKLATFEEECGTKWEDLMEIQLRNFNAKPPALPTCSAIELSNLDFYSRANVDSYDVGYVVEDGGY